MTSPADRQIRNHLAERREMLESALSASPGEQHFRELLAQVDAAIARLDAGTYGICKACGGGVEPERLLADPLVEFCLDHLSSAQQRALEEDLVLASRIQRELLPPKDLDIPGWLISYHFAGAGPVSGDYCDILTTDDGDFYFLIGDVTGKGVAASMLMAHLHATFKTLISFGLCLGDMVEHASRSFCESTLPTHFATLICGKASRDGSVKISNAGHQRPLVMRGSGISTVECAGLPLGIFCSQQFSESSLRLQPGDFILLYTDGVSEAQDKEGRDYGTDRLSDLVSQHASLDPDELISTCVRDIESFRSGTLRADDLTILILKRTDTPTLH
jgi:sigma-B regulation protein RsbU (phosphoserine phosphatase)